MNKLSLLALPLIAFSALSEARDGTFADQRGFAACTSEFRAASVGLVTDRHHYIDKRAENPRFYINGTRWEDGSRADVKMTCDTAPSGSTVLASEISAGKYKGQHTRITIEVADSNN